MGLFQIRLEDFFFSEIPARIHYGSFLWIPPETSPEITLIFSRYPLENPSKGITVFSRSCIRFYYWDFSQLYADSSLHSEIILKICFKKSFSSVFFWKYSFRNAYSYFYELLQTFLWDFLQGLQWKYAQEFFIYFRDSSKNSSIDACIIIFSDSINSSTTDSCRSLYSFESFSIPFYISPEIPTAFPPRASRNFSTDSKISPRIFPRNFYGSCIENFSRDFPNSPRVFKNILQVPYWRISSVTLLKFLNFFSWNFSKVPKMRLHKNPLGIPSEISLRFLQKFHQEFLQELDWSNFYMDFFWNFFKILFFRIIPRSFSILWFSLEISARDFFKSYSVDFFFTKLRYLWKKPCTNYFTSSSINSLRSSFRDSSRIFYKG